MVIDPLERRATLVRLPDCQLYGIAGIEEDLIEAYALARPASIRTLPGRGWQRGCADSALSSARFARSEAPHSHTLAASRGPAVCESTALRRCRVRSTSA